jgi:hypothetical protein
MLGAMLKVAQEDKAAAREFGKMAKMVKDAHLRKILSLNTSPTSSIVFVHGFRFVYGPVSKGATDGFDCTAYWGSLPGALSTLGWQGDFRYVKYYIGDYNHFNGAEQRYSADLHDPLYVSTCTGYYAGADGSNDESLDRLSCLFAQYLNYNFGQSNSDVAIVAHSMGGILVRNALARVQTDGGGQGNFPTSVGQVTDAITLNTPHTGMQVGDNVLACGGCQQASDLIDTGPVMTYLNTYGRNPQASAAITDWTDIGSTCDILVASAEIGNTNAENAVDMNARHAIIYDNPCYSHTSATSDADVTSRDASQYYCDTTDPDNNPCGTNVNGNNWYYRQNGHHAAADVYTELTGDAS